MGGTTMQPLQISAETAQMLAKKLGVPLEHIMHMPKHILLQKMMELTNLEEANTKEDED
jgi:tRNA A37 threonylcarbamoyltransferase TsaD